MYHNFLFIHLALSLVLLNFELLKVKDWNFPSFSTVFSPSFGTLVLSKCVTKHIMPIINGHNDIVKEQLIKSDDLSA